MIFFRQKAARVLGQVACLGQPCQKQPSTKTAVGLARLSPEPVERGNTKSGLPGSLDPRRHPVIPLARKILINRSSVSLLPRHEVGIALDQINRHQQRILMGEDWLPWEVEIIVEDYLSMLQSELRGEPFNKAEHRRNLLKLLPARNDGGVEFKHQNISAVLIEMGYPYVNGYKPARNFQRSLLPEIVERRVYAMPELSGMVSKLVQQPAEPATKVDDLLSILVDPPRQKKKEALYESSPASRVRARRNYLEQEARNQSLGRAGEELVLEFEHQRLWRAGQKLLAERIEHVAAKADGHGFDILSFETDGRERLVEVKTTRFGQMTPFFASNNEVEVSDKRSVEYHVYRLFDFSKSPRLFMLNGSMRSTCTLEAVQYRAMPGTIDE